MFHLFFLILAAVDRSLNSSLSDARDALINASLDALMAYGQQIPASQRVGSLNAPYSLRLMPMFVLAMLKSVSKNLSYLYSKYNLKLFTTKAPMSPAISLL